MLYLFFCESRPVSTSVFNCISLTANLALYSSLSSLCSGVARAWGQAHFGKGSSRVWLDEVRCTGNELTLEQCPKSAWGEHNCLHSEDAGVSCSPLTGRTTPASALVIHNIHKNKWNAHVFIMADGFACAHDCRSLVSGDNTLFSSLSSTGVTDNIKNGCIPFIFSGAKTVALSNRAVINVLSHTIITQPMGDHTGDLLNCVIATPESQYVFSEKNMANWFQEGKKQRPLSEGCKAPSFSQLSF